MFFCRRQETSTKPQRTETTVLFLPDVWSVMPSTEEYAKIAKLYEEALQSKLNPKENASPKKEKSSSKKDAAGEEKKVWKNTRLQPLKRIQCIINYLFESSTKNHYIQIGVIITQNYLTANV